MNRIINIICLIALILLLHTVSARAQNSTGGKTDKIVFVNGKIAEGRILAFVDDKVRFVYNGETLNYDFGKTDIEKIEYGSGRVEILTDKKPVSVTLPVNSKSKVAVMPMHYTSDGNSNKEDQMRYHLQEIAISYLSKSAAELKFIDATEVNALLRKSGIQDADLRKYTPKELATLLQVEYVISGSVLQSNGSLVTNTNGSSEKKEALVHHTSDDNYSREQHYNRSSVTNQHIETHVTLSIFNEAGEKIYSKSRQALLAEPDAYKNTIHYLLKRTPLYKR